MILRYIVIGNVSCVMSYNLLIVSTEDIVDVREGQNSDGFDRYPYEEVKEQSFSILVEGEMQGNYYYLYIAIAI